MEKAYSINRSPVYVQISNMLRQEADCIEPGGLFPSETVLAKRLRSSRVTVAKAVSTLVNEGILLRFQGKGTFVASKPPALKVVGCFVSGHSYLTHPLISHHLDDLRSVLAPSGYDLSLMEAGTSEREDDMFRCFLGQSASVRCFLAIAPHIDAESTALLRKAARPLVMLNGDSPAPGIPAVMADYEQAAYLATRHLVRLGHRRIDLLGGPSGYWLSQKSEDGFNRAIRETDLPGSSAFIHHVRFTGRDSYVAATDILAASNRPTAIVAGDDVIARGVMTAARDLSLGVPKDLALVGMGDLHLGSLSVPLTTVRFGQSLGTLAGQMLERLLAGETVGEQLVIQPELVVRGSCGSPVPIS